MIGQTLEQNLLLSDLMKISSVLPLQNYFDTKYIYFWKPKFPNSSCINILIILINIELVEKINY